MQTTRRIVNRILVIVSVFVATATGYADEGVTGSIAGKVLDDVTKQPLPGAHVFILGSALGVATDSNGVYTIRGVEENVYRLKYSSVGYTSHVEAEIRVVRGKVTTVKDIGLTEAVTSLDSIVTTAGYFPAENLTPTTNYTYSREEIRRSPGAVGDIFRAIETLPGVSSGGGEFSAFSVRGGSPRDNIVLVDNIPIDRVSHFDGGGTEEQEAQGGRFSVFAPGIIDEAKFQPGGFAAKYGGKNASFIDMKIKDGNRESITANASYDLLGWEVNYDGPCYGLGATSSIISARHQDFRKVLEMTDQKDMGSPSFSDVIFKTTTDFSPQHRLSLLGVYSPESFEITPENVFASRNGEYVPLIVKGSETKYVLGANWRYLTAVSSFWENTLYYKRDDLQNNVGRLYLDPVDGVMPTPATVPVRRNLLVVDNSDYQVGWKTQFTFSPSATSTIQLGGEVYRVALDYSRIQNGLDTAYTFDADDIRPDPTSYYVIRDPAEVNVDFTDKSTNANAFVDYKITAIDKLTLMPGLRYESTGRTRRHYLSPRFSVSYQVSERTKLSAATGVYYQEPDLRLLAYSERNASLGNEKALHYILGMTTYLSDDVKFTTETYYKSLGNLITAPDRSTLVRTNAGSGYAWGVDVGLVKRFSDRWYGQINYSYAVSKRDDHDGHGEYNADFSQPNMFNILVGYELDKEWSFSAKWKFATGRPKDSYIVHGNVFNNENFVRYAKEITGNNDQRFDDFHTLNVRVDYRHQFGRLAVVAFIDILNLYNKLNVSEEQFLETTGTSRENGFRMIPTFGVKVEY